MNKQILRNQIIQQRKLINTDEISRLIVKNIRENEIYKASKNIMIFYPLKHEINLLELLNDTDKKFFLPKINGENLLICPFDKKTKLNISKFKTKEPDTKPVTIDLIDLIFVPALCADKKNYRLGYGKGYYDRLLKNFKGKSIIPISKQFVQEKIPIDAFDVRTDFIITENY